MIFFFYGPNTFAARQQQSKMMAEYQKKTGSDLGIERIEGAKATRQQLAAALQASPFLANSRLVIIEGLSANKAVSAKVSELTGSIPDSTVAVFYDPQVDQRTSYFKHMMATAKPVKFEPLTPRQLHGWIQNEIKNLGAEIDGPAITKLLEVAGEDQWRLRNELTKLANRNNHVTLEVIEEMVIPNQNETIFDLVEAMSSGRTERAMTLYKQLRSDQMSEMHILSMIIWQLRNLLIAKLAGQMSSGELAKKAGMSPFVAGKMLTKCRGLSEEVLKAAFLKAVDTDYGIKTGEAAADVLVEQLVFQVSRDVTAKK